MTTFAKASSPFSIFLKLTFTAIDKHMHTHIHRKNMEALNDGKSIYACIPSVWFIFIITWNIHSYIFHVVGGGRSFHPINKISSLTFSPPLFGRHPLFIYLRTCEARSIAGNSNEIVRLLVVMWTNALCSEPCLTNKKEELVRCTARRSRKKTMREKVSDIVQYIISSTVSHIAKQ